MHIFFFRKKTNNHNNNRYERLDEALSKLFKLENERDSIKVNLLYYFFFYYLCILLNQHKRYNRKQRKDLYKT